jgi:anti-sigma-K factor RskA
MTHEQASELLAALALDAVDSVEREEIDRHVAQCPRCQSELDALREVAGAMGNSVEALPEGLWSSISRRIYDVQDGESAPTAQLILSGLSESAGPPRAVPSRSTRKARTVVTSLSALAAAAIIVLAFSLANANSNVSRLQGANGAVTAALATPGHRLVNLESPTHVKLAQFVLLPNGNGYLVTSALPALAGKETYQLWGVINGTSISMGLMGRSPQHVAFTVSGSPSPSVLAVTVEPSGGSVTPSSAIIASGAV